MQSFERVYLKPVQNEQAGSLAQALGCSEVLAALLTQRGIGDADEAFTFLEQGAEVAHDPFLLPDMDRAVAILEEAIERQEVIFIHGDYDVDGACSTVLLVEGLGELGAQLRWHVPDRFTEGYGVSQKAVEGAAADGCQILLSCDCGSSSHAAIERAQELGMRVIITDHHHLPAHLPCPEAFVTPQRDDCVYPFRELCGTGVAYKLVCAMRERRGDPAPEQFLDLVALATIADVVPLLGENRGLVRAGLRRLSLLERPGLRALAQIADIEEGPWGSFAVGFGLGPRLNAAGRLEHARLAVELLLESDPDEARRRAKQLDELNRTRRAIEKNIREEVEKRVEEDPSKLALGVIVEAGEDWHQGVVGITASRVVERFGQPAFIMGQVGDIVKGSARSPENVDLYEAMKLCSDVFLKFGGHARAAGFTLRADRVDEMRERLSVAVAQVRRGPAPLSVDLDISLRAANLELARELRRLEPVGEGNREPVFMARRVRLENPKTMGKDGDHMRLMASQGGVRRKAVAFRQGADCPQLLPDRLYYDVLFRLTEETWDGNSFASLHVEAILEPIPEIFQILNRRWLPDSEGGCRFVDARNVLDRPGYVKALQELVPHPVLVVATTGLEARVRQSVGPELRIQLYRDLRDTASDMVLLSPPPQLEALRSPALQAARRIHCLFGEIELQQEQQRHQLATLDRTRMEAIWRAIRKHTRDGVLESTSWAEVEREVSQLPANQETVRAAVGVLEELGLATWQSEKRERLLLSTRGGRKLEESRRFHEYGRRGHEFSHVCRVFQERELRLLERLSGA